LPGVGEGHAGISGGEVRVCAEGSLEGFDGGAAFGGFAGQEVLEAVEVGSVGFLIFGRLSTGEGAAASTGLFFEGDGGLGYELSCEFGESV
jgi:hypothetical protein